MQRASFASVVAILVFQIGTAAGQYPSRVSGVSALPPTPQFTAGFPRYPGVVEPPAFSNPMSQARQPTFGMAAGRVPGQRVRGISAQYAMNDSFANGQVPDADGYLSYPQDSFDGNFTDYGQGDGLYGAGQNADCSPWFGGVFALIMTSDGDDSVILDCDCTPLQTSDAETDWQGGVEARLGRYICGGPSAWEFVYWGIYPATQEANSYSVDTALDLTSLNYGGGTVNDLYDGAARHRLRRTQEFYNFELNFLSGRSEWGGYGRNNLYLGWSLGVRYLNINEEFQYASADTNTTFGADPANDVYYDIDLENHLVGVQLGLRGDYQVWERWSMFGETKFGLYGNYIEHDTWIGGTSGTAVVNTGPDNGSNYDVTSTKNDVAFVGELRLGTSYHFMPRLLGTIGYRAVAITGVARAPSQIPREFQYIDTVADVNSAGSMILHGAFAGLEYNY